MNRGDQDSGAERGGAMFDELIGELSRLERTHRMLISMFYCKAAAQDRA